MKQVKPGGKEWHQRQIAAYRKQFGAYKTLAKSMREILEAACRAIAPLAIVQARPKSLSSFAEKALRKFREGEPETHDPVNKLTDLCGARVITSTQEQVEAVCDFVRANFFIREQQPIAAPRWA